MHTCGQCIYYLDKRKDCPHQEKTALDEGCDKFKYTNPEKRIDYLQAENKQLKEENKAMKLKLSKRSDHNINCRRYKYGNNYECTCGFE